MAVQQVIDFADRYSASAPLNIDIGGWDFVVVQLVTPTGTTSFLTSNDGGGITGVSDGNSASASNFIAVTGTNLATATGATSLAADGLIKFSGIGQYLRLSGGSAVKVLVRYYKSY